MPELPEVQTVVSTLRPRLVGRQLGRIRHLRPDILAPEGVALQDRIEGRAVRCIDRRGKRILIRLENGTLYIHLGMTGRLTVEPVDAPVLPHTHLRLEIEAEAGSAREELRFRDPRRFGGIWWLEPTECDDGGMGPEPLTLRAQELARRLGRTRRAIKTALLDQGLIAGLGNIYVDEALHAAGIHPLTPASALPAEACARLNRCIKRVLRKAIRSRGSSLRDYVDADGQPGGFQKLHRVYAREGKPCDQCGSAIQRIVLGGRSTHFCPECQKLA